MFISPYDDDDDDSDFCEKREKRKILYFKNILCVKLYAFRDVVYFGVIKIDDVIIIFILVIMLAYDPRLLFMILE